MSLLEAALADLNRSDPSELPLAEPIERVKASLADLVLTYGPAIVGWVASLELNDPMHAAGTLLLGCTISVLLGVMQCARLVRTGQTWGKALVGIRVVRIDGSRAGFLHGFFLRNVVFNGIVGVGNLLWIGGILAIVDSALLFTHDHRTLHDRLAGTMVVRV